MGEKICISDHEVRFPRATKAPNFKEKRVIASSPWEYVSLWLRKNGNGNSFEYWEQSKHFFESARELPVQSAALPLYYSFLNAVKALLETKAITYSPYHGIQGFDMRTPVHGRISIDNEGLKIKGGGVLPSLINYFSEEEVINTYTLGGILSNIAFVHRAFSISYRRAEIFLSLEKPRYVKAGAGQARFQADFPEEFSHGQTLNTLPASFSVREADENEDEENQTGFVIESNATFPWAGARRPSDADMNALADFHSKLRLDLNYISGSQPSWYIKRNLAAYTRIDRNNLTLIFMAMHRMSEIARYKPVELNKLLDSKKNWIIYEFIRTAQNQFIDEIAAEITGSEISPAGVRQGIF